MYVYVVDDEPDVARTLIHTAERLGHSGSYFRSGEAFLDVADDLAPGCVLLDLSLASKSGLQVLTELIERNHSHAIAMISGRGKVPDVVASMRAGAIDFLRKPYRLDELRNVFARAADFLAERRQRAQNANRFDLLDSLSPRERNVMDALGRGLTTKEVAVELALSPRTVEMHRSNILRKLRLSSISSALVFARDAAVANGDLR